MITIVSKERLTELEASNKGLLQKLQETENLVKNLQDMSKDMTEKQAQHAEEISNLTNAHAKALEELKASHEKQISELKNTLQSESTSTEAKAQRIVASVGLPMDDLPAATKTEPLTIETASAKMKSDPTYFTQHKDEILKLVGISPESWNATHKE